MNQDTSEAADEGMDDEGEELIEIVHNEEGTSVRIEDVTPLEFAALVVIGLVVVSVVFAWWRRRRARGHHYSMDPRRDQRDRRLP